MTSNQDRAFLEELVDLLQGYFIPLASRPSELLAIGELWQAIEAWIDGKPKEVEVNVSVGIVVSVKDDEGYVEAQHLDVRANSGEVSLSTLNRTYSPTEGSDHHSEVMARLSMRQGFVDYDARQWLQVTEEYARHEVARLSVSRDHL